MNKFKSNNMTNSLRKLLKKRELILMPCCYDAMSAKLIEQAGFDLTFLSGFAASASRIGKPDLGLMSYAEVLNQTQNVIGAINIPMMADGDTGYGNPLNVERTVEGFARSGVAGVMIEDQMSPKRCGHTIGKRVVSKEEAFYRIEAAVDVAKKFDILILARTDSRRELGLKEAIERAQKFYEIGADIIFVEEPFDENEMKTICKEVPGPMLANMLEGGQTPILNPEKLSELGFSISAYPISTLSSSMQAITNTLNLLKEGKDFSSKLMDFNELKERIGFNEYYEREKKYKS